VEGEPARFLQRIPRSGVTGSRLTDRRKTHESPASKQTESVATIDTLDGSLQRQTRT
jgi:hypothetical protein